MKRVVIVGAGFGGLTCAQALAKEAGLEVTVLDRTNHHLFQPLLYQVATAALSSTDIAAPVRGILDEQKNARVLLTEVTKVDPDRRVVTTNGEPAELEYDWLVLACGAKTSYFGHDEWEAHAPGLKTLEDAVEIRTRILLAFERAEATSDEALRRRLLTFVLIGGGPSGVELAGSISELARNVISEDFRSIRPQETRVILVEGGKKLLSSFGTHLAHRTKEQLEELGVEVRLGVEVKQIEEGLVHLADDTRIEAETVLWAAGVGATQLAAKVGQKHDKSGRVVVEPDCSISGHPEVFVVGDMAHYAVPGPDGKPTLLPGVSPVAMQQARYVAKIIRGRNDERAAFQYFDKGSMATIGRSKAIAKVGKLEMSGFIAWLAWLFVHLWYLVGFKNRLAVFFNWLWQYLTFRRGARVVVARKEVLDWPRTLSKPAALR